MNPGSLGFLTEIPLAELYPNSWRKAMFVGIEVRSMMHIELHRKGKAINRWDALNDVVAAFGGAGRPHGRFSIDIDQQFVAAMRVDGIIVWTLPVLRLTTSPPMAPLSCPASTRLL